MPGNEDIVISFLVQSLQNKESLHLPTIGDLKEVSMPIKEGKKIINNTLDLENFSSNDRYKKADVYLNDCGISLKEECAPLYNKIQRKHLPNLINFLFSNKSHSLENIISSLDFEIDMVNKGAKRDIPWSKIFSENDFKMLLEFLMMKGYADTSTSSHQADYILIAPKKISPKNFYEIKVLSFREYFERYKDKIMIAARRIWIGSNSKSENKRALSMSKSEFNKEWIYKNISGEPRQWDRSFPKEDRREIFYLNLNS